MEFYRWLLRQNGFDVSDTGYFVYCNGNSSQDRFDGVVRFKVSMIPYSGNAAWVECALMAARFCLESDAPPAAGADCEQRAYLEDIGKLALRLVFNDRSRMSLGMTSDKHGRRNAESLGQFSEMIQEETISPW